MTEGHVPAFFKVIVWIAVIGLALLGGFTVGLNRWLCQETVQRRDDGRAVWLYLVARDPDRADDPDVVEFVAFLDDNLPALGCTWWGDSQPVED